MQILGLGRKSTSDIFRSFPAAAMSSISFLTQCHSFSPVLQRHCSSMPAKQMMVLLCGKQEIGPEEHSSLSLWFFVWVFVWLSQTFSRNDYAFPRRYVQQWVWCFRAEPSPCSALGPGIIALRGSGSQQWAAAHNITGDLQSPALTHHTQATAAFWRVNQSSYGSNSEPDGLHEDMVLD